MYLNHGARFLRRKSALFCEDTNFFVNLHHKVHQIFLYNISMCNTITKYFPELSEEKIGQFKKMLSLYPEWNDKINVISRKDIENLEINHILHSLAIAKFLPFVDGTTVLDIGTGGGFPGIPLAVLFPDVKFHLIDRIGKKLKVAADVVEKLGLDNVTIQHGDIGECRQKFDFVVSRAVMPQNDLMKLVRKNIASDSVNAVPNGLITLKGGNLQEELKNLRRSEIIDVSQYFNEPFFETKKIVYTPA